MAPASLVERTVAALRSLWEPRERLRERAAVLLACACVLPRCERPLSFWSAAAALVLWLRHDARRAQEALTRKELEPQSKVAKFAERLGSTEETNKIFYGPAIAEDGHEECTFTNSRGSLRFGDIRRRTHCLFAARAEVWGNDWLEEPCGRGADDGAVLAANVALSIPRFYRFCLEVKAGKALDAFVFEARGPCYGSDLNSFAATVRSILAGFSALDPAGMDCMRKNYIGRRGWYYEFARESFFVTSFAPCYPANHPRYQFEEHPDSCFVLLQPEESFLRHDLPPDRPRSATNWEEPADVRDRIRVNFRQHGREYRIPETVSYPPAEFIVPPLDVHDTPVQFWLPPAASATKACDARPEGSCPVGGGGGA